MVNVMLLLRLRWFSEVTTDHGRLNNFDVLQLVSLWQMMVSVLLILITDDRLDRVHLITPFQISIVAAEELS